MDNVDIVGSTRFMLSLGTFEYTKVKFSHSPMMDMTDEVLTLISDLMRVRKGPGARVGHLMRVRGEGGSSPSPVNPHQ